jgi:hypothetical protein
MKTDCKVSCSSVFKALVWNLKNGQNDKIPEDDVG